MNPRNLSATACLLMAGLLTGISQAGCSSSSPQGGKDASALTHSSAKVPEVPPFKAEPVDQKLRQRAQAQVKASANSPSAFIRAHAIEACRQALPVEGRSIILAGISDDVPLVKFSALVAAGELRITDAYRPALPWVKATDKSVSMAAIFCVHRLGDRRFSHEFEKAATNQDHYIRANTALLLGMMGEPSADRILQYLLKDVDPIVRLQAAEALWRLHHEEALEVLISATISRYPDDQMIAATALAAPRDPRVIGHLRGMLSTAYPEINLVAARGLGALGHDDGYGVAIKYLESPDLRQRQLAAMALGAIGRIDAQSKLAPMLDNKDEDVRLAAATGLLQLKGQ